MSPGSTGAPVGAPLPAAFQEVADDFAAMPATERLALLLEFSDDLPPLPERYTDHPELLEPVPECQSPIFLVVDVDGAGKDARVDLHFSAPAEAPTTRGFAGILHDGLDGRTAAEVLDTPPDLPLRLNITAQVSPLRLNGMAGMLTRIKRQVTEKAGL